MNDPRILTSSLKKGEGTHGIVKTLITVIILLVVLLILITAGQLAFFFQMFGWFQYKIRTITGSDALIANGVAAILMAIIFTLPLWGFIRSFLPLPQKSKKLYRALVLGCFAILFFASYFFSQNIFFDVNTGKPLKYYSILPNGQYKFHSSGGYDPLTGDELKMVTKDVVIDHLERVQSGNSSQPQQSLTLKQAAEQNEDILLGLMIYFLFSLFIGILGFYCALDEKRKSPVLWFITGFLFNLFGLVFLILITDMSKKLYTNKK